MNCGFIEPNMFAQQEALVKLLQDDDPHTVQLVKDQLASAGEEWLPHLRELGSADNATVSRHVRDVVTRIHGNAACGDFSLLCHFFGEGVDLETAGWALARALEPEIPILPREYQVNEWGREFLSRIHLARSNTGRVEALSGFLAGELGFQGNADSYYCVQNSLLPRVIANRRGIPISLTLLYMMVGSRAAMKIEGINLPGHFIARHGGVFFDPFHCGRILCRCDIEEILLRQGLEFDESLLAPATPRQMMLRMLANLLYVYNQEGCCEKYALVRGWMNAVRGSEPAA